MITKIRGVDFTELKERKDITTDTGRFSAVFVECEYDPVTNLPDVQEVLELFYSKSDIKRLRKQGAIKLAQDIPLGHFLYVGKERKIVIVQANLDPVVWWSAWAYDYFFSVKPKHLDWKVIE